jgi:branched-chain amino acid transport system ATP-binding protein
MLDVSMALLDEPVGGVNPVLAHNILGQIRTIRDELHVAFLMVEHRLDIVMKYVDKVYVLANGAVLCSGTPEEIMKNRQVYDIYLA